MTDLRNVQCPTKLVLISVRRRPSRESVPPSLPAAAAWPKHWRFNSVMPTVCWFGLGVERVRVVHAGSPCDPCTRHHPLVPVADPCPAASTRTWTPGGPSQVLPGTRTGSTWTFPTRSLVHGSSHLLPGSYPGKSMYAWSRPGIQVLPGRWKESPRQDRQKVQLQTTYSMGC